MHSASYLLPAAATTALALLLLPTGIHHHSHWVALGSTVRPGRCLRCPARERSPAGTGKQGTSRATHNVEDGSWVHSQALTLASVGRKAGLTAAPASSFDSCSSWQADTCSSWQAGSYSFHPTQRFSPNIPARYACTVVPPAPVTVHDTGLCNGRQCRRPIAGKLSFAAWALFDA